jgi:hypothetical protein
VVKFWMWVLAEFGVVGEEPEFEVMKEAFL